MKVFNVNGQRKHTIRALLLAISLAACGSLIWFTSSLTSMQELRIRLANDGHGLLFELARHTTQAVHKPNIPASRWYVDLSTGVARELSDNDVVAMGLRTPHASLHSLFRVREDLVALPNKGGLDSATEAVMLPVFSVGKIKEFSMERNEYSLRCTGGGENFSIVFPNAPVSPIELLMHAFVPQDTDRMGSFSSRGKPAGSNIQLRDLNDPGLMLAEWNRSEECLPAISGEHMFTLSSDKTRVEKRSLLTGELLDTTSFQMPAGTAPTVLYIDPENDFFIGQDNSSGTKGMLVADFRQGAQIAFVPDAYPLDYAPVSKCIMLETLNVPRKPRCVFSIESGKAVELEGINESNLLTLFLCPSEPRAVAVMRDESIQVHSLPDGKLVSTISSMQNHKDFWVLLSVLPVATWVVCLVVSGRRLAANESLDIAIVLVVTWGSLYVLHQRTGISFGLGGVLSSFSIGAAIAVAIVLTEWGLHNSAIGLVRLVKWTFAFGLLLGILGIMRYDELMFDACSFREAVLVGSGLVGIGYIFGRIMDVQLKRKYHSHMRVAENQSQWSITHLLWCTALVAFVMGLLGIPTASNRIDWLWLGKCLAVYSLLIAVGMYGCTVWRFGLHRGKPLALLATSAILIACCGLVAFVSYHFMYRVVFSPISINGFDFYLWYLVGFMSMFASLVYRTSPRSQIPPIQVD